MLGLVSYDMSDCMIFSQIINLSKPRYQGRRWGLGNNMRYI